MKLFKNNQSGRSMIEMLGVLAIIGVLSVGGIAGYSKAMNKYKISKTTDQVSMLIANIRTMFSAQGNYKNLTTNTAIDFGAIPDDMVKTENGTRKIKNLFGGDVDIGPSDLLDFYDERAFVVAYTNIPTEACVSISTSDWGSDQSSGLAGMGIVSGFMDYQYLFDTFLGSGIQYINEDGGEFRAAVGGGSTFPIPVAQAVSACNGTGNTILWKYY